VAKTILAVALFGGIGVFALSLAPDRLVPEVSAAEAASAIAQEAKPVVVAFVTRGCVFCKGSTRLLREVASDVGDDARFMQVDLAKYPEFAAQYDVVAVPTIVVFRDHTPHARTSLIGSKRELDMSLR